MHREATPSVPPLNFQFYIKISRFSIFAERQAIRYTLYTRLLLSWLVSYRVCVCVS